jgi:hypothetical protein
MVVHGAASTAEQAQGFFGYKGKVQQVQQAQGFFGDKGKLQQAQQARVSLVTRGQHSYENHQN